MDGSAFAHAIPSDRELIIRAVLALGSLVAIGAVIGWFARGFF